LALDNLEGVINYEAEKLELEKRREDIQSKVTKKQRKVERQKEKMKAKQVIEKKVSHSLLQLLQQSNVN